MHGSAERAVACSRFSHRRHDKHRASLLPRITHHKNHDTESDMSTHNTNHSLLEAYHTNRYHACQHRSRHSDCGRSRCAREACGAHSGRFVVLPVPAHRMEKIVRKRWSYRLLGGGMPRFLCVMAATSCFGARVLHRVGECWSMSELWPEGSLVAPATHLCGRGLVPGARGSLGSIPLPLHLPSVARDAAFCRIIVARRRILSGRRIVSHDLVQRCIYQRRCAFSCGNSVDSSGFRAVGIEHVVQSLLRRFFLSTLVSASANGRRGPAQQSVKSKAKRPPLLALASPWTKMPVDSGRHHQDLMRNQTPRTRMSDVKRPSPKHRQHGVSCISLSAVAVPA